MFIYSMPREKICIQSFNYVFSKCLTTHPDMKSSAISFNNFFLHPVGHTTTDSRRTPTTLTTRDPTLVAEKPAKRAETDRPQKGGSSSRADTPLEETDLANADNTLKESDHSRAEKPLKESDSSRADKPLIITDSAESKPSQKNKNSSPSRYRALADTCVLWCLPVLLSLSHLFKARDKSFT